MHSCQLVNLETGKLMETTHFGFKTVDASEKPKLVEGVFKSVASKYDIMNDVMSLGLHRLWKDEMVRNIKTFEGAKFLDLAGGTGDITFRMNEILRKRIQTDEDLITVSIENMSYTVDLTDMTITHKNKYGQNYILSYIDEIKWMEYLLIPDESIHLNVSSSSSHIIRISRVITPIRSFVLKNY